MDCSTIFYVNLILLLVVIIFVSKGYLESFSAGPTPKGPEVVYLYWSSCGHCKNFIPEWNKFEKISITPTVKMETKDKGVDAFLAIAKQGGFFKGYPCIFFLNTDGTAVPYSGQRTAQDILSWQKNLMSGR